MIRRTALYGQPDRRVVKWALLAAALALPAGYFAEHKLAPRTAVEVDTVEEQAVEVPTTGAARRAS